MADSYEINLEIQGGEQPALVMETEGGATDGASARNAEAWAAGTRNGVPVGENDPAYHNNSKYYRDSAAAIAAGNVIDDDAGHGDTMLAWSADKLVKEFGSKHEDMTAGNALFLLSDRGETDNEPYAFRKTGGSKNAYGREKLTKVVGGTVGWNQLLSPVNFPRTIAGVTFTFENGVTSISGTATNSYGTLYPTVKMIVGHVFLETLKFISNPSGLNIGVGSLNNGITARANTGYAIKKIVADVGYDSYGIQNIGTNVNLDGTKYMACIFDLTQMFGSTIADAIYEMEQATAGAGVAWFRSLFPKSYYAYDAGTLMSVNAESHALTGFNQWDEETRNGYYDSSTGAFVSQSSTLANKNMIPVTPNTTYYCKSGTYHVNTVYFDKSMNFIGGGYHKENATFTTPANCYFLGFSNDFGSGTTYNHDVCINLSDTAKNGTYEPYQLRSYPLANVELRGVPKWVDGQIVFDGDEYTPDGTVKRRYGIVDLGTLTWVASSGAFYSTDLSTLIKLPASTSVVGSYICSSLEQIPAGTALNANQYAVAQNGRLWSKDSSSATAADFKTAMSGVYLVYELATPTTESADPYRELQISNRNGTEEFVDRAEEAGTRDVAIPVGIETFYPVDVFALIDSLQALILENISNS